MLGLGRPPAHSTQSCRWWRAKCRLEGPEPTRRPRRGDGPTPSSRRWKCLRARRLLASWAAGPKCRRCRLLAVSWWWAGLRQPAFPCASTWRGRFWRQGQWRFGAVSPSTPDTEATSAAPPDWTTRGGACVLNVAAQDVRAWFNAQGAVLQQYMQEFLATRVVVRVGFLLSCFRFL